MSKASKIPAVVAEQLAAFERLQPEFAASFHYVQEVQGQRRFPAFPIEASVRYLHALWVCDCKDRLLSAPKTRERYEGQRCLHLLERWQTGESAGVVAFLQRKLEPLPFADITRQIQALRREDGARALVERLEYGRRVLLHRGMNLLLALEPICTFPEQRLVDEVRATCAHYGHQPDQIRHQLLEREAARAAFVLHPALAQRNMRVMDQLGVQITTDAPDQPGQRTWRVAKRTMPEGPYAEQVIRGYVALTAPWRNNPIGRRFLDVPMPSSTRASTAST
jgi:hypothetical protein